MKKTVFIAAVAALALFACQKTEQAAPEEPDAPAQKEQVQEPVGGDIAVFTASVDGSVTKTSLEDDTEGKKVVWTAGDKINVNGTVLTLETENQPDGYGPGCTKGSFAGNKPSANGTGAKYKAVYPASLRDNYGYYNLPLEQHYSVGNISDFPMYAQNDDATLEFKNLCGIVRIGLKGSKSISSIILADKGSDPKPMSGRFVVNENAAVMQSATPNGTTLTCATPVGLNDYSFTYFHLTVPAATYGKLQILIEASDGTICSLTSKSPVTVTRSKIKEINLSNPSFKDMSGENLKITYTTNNSAAINKYAKGADASVFGEGLTVSDHTYENGVGTITMSGPVTSIGYEAFRSIGNLVTLTIPSTVTSIGTRALSSCSNLESVNFPAGLTVIGQTAFANSNKFVPDDMSHITSIGEEAFQHINLSGLITIPDGLTLLGRRAFYDNDKITEVMWNHTPATMGVEIFASCNKIETVTFADDIDIPASMFNGCDKITTIVFDASVNSIGDAAFGSCKALVSLTLPPSVTYLSNSAFAYCTALETINLSDNITYIGEGAFSNCTSLQEIVLPAKLATIYNRYNFSGCTSLTSVTFPENETFHTIPSLCFDGCTNLVSTSIPVNVTSIADNAFRNCGFKALPEGWGRRSLYSNNVNPYAGCPISSITFPDDWTSIPENFCNGWKSLATVNLGSGVTSVGAGAFRGCTALTSVTIPSQVASLGSYCFASSGLTSLPNGINRADISLSDHVFASSKISSVDISAWTIVPNGCFQECSLLSSVTLGNSLTTIAQYAFYICPALTSITIPASVTAMGQNCFQESGLTDLPSGLHDCTSWGTNIFSKTPLTSITFPVGMTTVPEKMFSGCASLTTVNLNDVTSIGNYAFSSCSILSTVSAPKLETVGQYAFTDNNGLISIELPVVRTLGTGAFNMCKNLLTVDLGSNIHSIASDCINCNPASVTAIYIRNGASICSLGGRLSGYALNASLKIYVPTALLDSYKGAANWVNYRDYIQGIDVPVSMSAITSMKLGDGSVSYYSLQGILSAFGDNGGTLTFLEDISSELTFIGSSTGVVDMNGHSTNKVFWMQNTGGSITIRNGTFSQTGDCLDGKTGFDDGYGGTVILENMTVKGTLWTDSHPYIIRSGDYNQIRNMKKNDVTSTGSGTVTIEGGRFKSFYNYSKSGWTYGDYIISGGKFAFDPRTATNTTIATGYKVESNTDSDSGTYPYIVVPE